MADRAINLPTRVHVDVTLFRSLPMSPHRERRVFITESARMKAVQVGTFGTDGERLPGTLTIFPRDLPAFLAALTEAAAAIGVEIPAKPAQ